MEDYKALYLSQHYHFPSLMQPQFIPLHDQEQNYYYALILIDYLSKSQQFTSPEVDDSYLKSIIQAIYYYKNDTHKFILKLSEIDSILLKQKNLEFIKALLSNKYIIEQDPDYILQMIQYSLSDQQVLTFIVMQVAQNQIKYSLKSLFKAIIRLQEVNSFIQQCFQYFYLNDQMFNLDLQSSGINLKLTINLTKRLLKWSNFSHQNILNEIDLYFQKNIGISEKQILLAYILTASNSQLAMRKPLLLKIFIQAIPQSIFYFEKMLKYMRLHNHKDVDYAYRIGTLNLDEDQANLFRISLQFEQEIKKSLNENPNKGEILEILKKAFMREPYTFSLDFIVFLLKFEYQYESVQVVQNYWKLMKLINKFFFDSLYSQQIYNIFDYQGVFHDENGKSKLITKVGNMKKNAKVLIPYISQMILNSQQIIHLVSRYFIQMFVENNKIDYFYTNFIYEPYKSQDNSTINYQLSQKLFKIFPLILSKLRNGSQLCHKYLIKLKELLHFCAQNKSFHNLKKIEVLVLKLDSNNNQEIVVIQKIHEVIFEKVKRGLDQNQADNILSIFDEKKSILFDFPEYKIFQHLLDIKIKIENYNISNPAHQYMFLSLATHLSDVFDKYLQQQFVKILIKKLPMLLEESGYFIQQIEQKSYQQEIQRIDNKGEIYYDIVDVHEENIRQYVKKRNQKQILILLQTLEKLIEFNNTNFEIEGFCTIINQLLNLYYYAEDTFLLEYWNIAINILKRLDQFTSHKEMEIKMINSFQKILQYEVITKESIQLIMILEVDAKQDDLSLLIHCLDLINQLKNESKSFMIKLIFSKFQPKDQELFSSIYFERKIESEQIEITEYYLKQLIQESTQLQYFIFTLRICCELTNKQIQEQLIEYISEHLSQLGLEYLAIIFIIAYDRRSLVTDKAKCFLKCFQNLLQQLNNNVQDYCNLLNVILFICQNETESEIIYTVFRKFFQLYIPNKKQFKCKNFMKKQLQILQQFSFFFNEIQQFQLKATLTFNPIKYFNSNTQKVPISVRETFSQIKYFEQMCQLCFFSFTETCKIQRKYIQDVLKQRTQEQQCVDSRIYQFQLKSKCIKQQMRINPLSASPVQFYSDNKGIEKIFRKE